MLNSSSLKKSHGMRRIVYELNSWLGYRVKHMAMLNPTSCHQIKLSIMPSTSYAPTFLRTSSPTNGGPWSLAARWLTLGSKTKETPTSSNYIGWKNIPRHKELTLGYVQFLEKNEVTLWRHYFHIKLDYPYSRTHILLMLETNLQAWV